MQAVNTAVKQYVVTMLAGAILEGVSPNNPTRIYMRIQNTGANPMFVRFDNNIQLDNGDTIIMPGDAEVFKDPCPVDRVSYYSALGTTASVIEGVSR